ncbi:MAG: hypothetical protein PHC66_03325 [Candidatus Nanoarchaeia archaeon]|nr:hypothetical protein [Candidatus Nanoarchaeia archaeon]MDD5239848.1 hypothetical protein [Candidatus Nanoarchaeia archaeon]
MAVDYAKEISKAALGIGAITLKPDDPYTWASGFRMPIYNDNRKHLHYPANRKMITGAFYDIIIKNNISVDAVSGTSTAGIAPAASLAQLLNVPLLIIDNNTICEYSPEFVRSLTAKIVDKLHDKYYNAIASTCPHAIIPAVFAANDKEVSFAYAREKPKSHGLQQQIEGIVDESDNILLVDFYKGTSYADKAKAALEEKKALVKDVLSEDISAKLIVPKLDGKTILHIEDLVSTGGSCIEEIQTFRAAGATVAYCAAIFSYDFPESLKKFSDINCNFRAALGYEQLLEGAIETGAIKPEQHEMLKEWRQAPFEWGAKRGFPKVEKK